MTSHFADVPVDRLSTLQVYTHDDLEDAVPGPLPEQHGSVAGPRLVLQPERDHAGRCCCLAATLETTIWRRSTPWQGWTATLETTLETIDAVAGTDRDARGSHVP